MSPEFEPRSQPGDRGNVVWDSKTTRSLRAALDEAIGRAVSLGFHEGKYGIPMEEALATAIAQMAERGERDHGRLVEGALQHLGPNSGQESSAPQPETSGD